MNDTNTKVLAVTAYQNLSKKIMLFRLLSIILTIAAFYIILTLYGESKSLIDVSFKGLFISSIAYGYSLYVRRTIKSINAQRHKIYTEIAAENSA